MTTLLQVQRWRVLCRVLAGARHRHDQPTAVVFYRWPTMRHLRFISRFKVYQVSCVLALLGPVTHWYHSGLVDGQTLVSAWGAGGGTTAVLFVLSYYFRRFVGEMALLPTSDQLRVSLLTFWGNRRELCIPLEQVVPFADSQTVARGGRSFQVLEIAGTDMKFLYSLRYGRVLDSEALKRALTLE